MEESEIAKRLRRAGWSTTDEDDDWATDFDDDEEGSPAVFDIGSYTLASG